MDGLGPKSGNGLLDTMLPGAVFHVYIWQLYRCRQTLQIFIPFSQAVTDRLFL